MSKITRYNGNVVPFANNAQAGELFDFGSSVDQNTDLTSLVNADYLRGWGVVGASDFPPLEWFNAQAFTHGQFISYLHQMGVPEWNATQEYPTEGGLTIHNGRKWSRGSSWTVGDEPLVNSGTWKLEDPVFQYVVSQLAGGDKSKVAFIKEGESLTAFDWFIYSNGQIYAKNGATGAFSEPLDFDPVTGIDSGVTGALVVKSVESDINAINTSRLNFDHYGVFADRKTVGSTGGSSVVGNNIRVINTEVVNSLSGVTLGTNQLVFDGVTSDGTYYVKATQAVLGGGNVKSFLWDNTNSVRLLDGIVGFCDPAAPTGLSVTMDGLITISGVTAIEVNLYCSNARASNGLGVTTGEGAYEQYLIIELWRIS